MSIVVVFLPVCFFFVNSFCTALGWIVLGCKGLFEVVSRVLVLRLMSRLAYFYILKVLNKDHVCQE